MIENVFTADNLIVQRKRNAYMNVNEWFFLWFYGHGGEMVSVIALIAVNRGFEPRSGQAKDYILCCFSTVVTVDLDYNN